MAVYVPFYVPLFRGVSCGFSWGFTVVENVKLFFQNVKLEKLFQKKIGSVFYQRFRQYSFGQLPILVILIFSK
jgi:hypothetical protein